MPNKQFILLLLALGIMLPLPQTRAQNMAQPSANRSARKSQPMPGKQTWQQSVELNLPISTAKIQIRSRFEAMGYILKHEIPIGNNSQESCIMLWEKGDNKVIVMLRKTDIDRTWFSQGEFKDAK